MVMYIEVADGLKVGNGKYTRFVWVEEKQEEKTLFGNIGEVERFLEETNKGRNEGNGRVSILDSRNVLPQRVGGLWDTEFRNRVNKSLRRPVAMISQTREVEDLKVLFLLKYEVTKENPANSYTTGIVIATGGTKESIKIFKEKWNNDDGVILDLGQVFNASVKDNNGKKRKTNPVNNASVDARPWKFRGVEDAEEETSSTQGESHDTEQPLLRRNSIEHNEEAGTSSTQGESHDRRTGLLPSKSVEMRMGREMSTLCDNDEVG
jgi:hypothetical protein